MRYLQFLIVAGAVLSMSGCSNISSIGTVTASATSDTVTGESPADMSTDVAIDAVITAIFSAPVPPANQPHTTFTITDVYGAAVAGAIAFSEDGASATFRPSTPFSYATAYTAKIVIGGTGSSPYQWGFTTTGQDAPKITSVTPAANASGVATHLAISVQFSQTMNANSITAATFKLTGPNGAAVPGTVTYTGSDSVATFVPEQDLAYSSQYTATITSGVLSAAGTPITAGYAWTFTTGIQTAPAPAPTVTEVTPAADATGVAWDTAITARFSQTMDATSISGTTFLLRGSDGASVPGTVSFNSTSSTASLSLAQNLAYNSQYTATITTGAHSAAGVPVASNFSWSFTTGAPANLATVDFGTTFQTIRGFGGSNAWLPQLTSQQAAVLFSPSSGLGLSILRVRIDPTGKSTSNWVPSNGGWATELASAKAALTANPSATIFASPWTPPISMKNSSATQPYYAGPDGCDAGAGACGGFLDGSNYGAYAEYLESFVKYFADGGVGLYGVSLQNEPDYSAQPGQNWESCSWTAQQIETWTDGYASALTTKLIMPESASFDAAEAAPSLSDPTAAAQTAIIGGHLYGTTPMYYAAAENANKEVWMTEHFLTPAGAQPEMPDALQLATEIQNSLVAAQYNAYVWWSIQNNAFASINYGLITEDATNPTPTYYGYALGQYARFVQPGYARVAATENPSGGVLVSAFTGSQAGATHYVIVAINTGTSAVTQHFAMLRSSAGAVTPYETTSSGGLVKRGDVTVSEGSFTYTLPAQSITTFVQ